MADASEEECNDAAQAANLQVLSANQLSGKTQCARQPA